MSIDLGSSNTTRYHSVPDHADFSLPNADWAWIVLAYPENSAATKYLISTGPYQTANAFNLIWYLNGSFGVSANVSTLSDAVTSTSPAVDKWYWVYATRRGGSFYAGRVAVDGTFSEESGAVGIAAGYNSAVGPNIGRRSDGTADRHWKGRWGQTAFVSGAGVTLAQVMELANGVPLLSMPFAPNIKALWHGKNASSSTIVDIVGGHVATRQGTTYGTNEEDIRTPYIWVPEYLRGIASVGGTTYNKSLAGSLTPTAALTKQTLKGNGGFLSMSGGLAKKTFKTYTGSLTAAGAVAKRTTKTFAGSITGSGALSTMILFTAAVAGSITPSGAIGKMTLKALAGSSTLAGAITKKTFRTLDGNISVSGVLTKLTKKAMAGSVTVAGVVTESYQVLKTLVGSIKPTGALAAVYIAFVAGVLKLLALMGIGQ